jgi:two-component system, NarL family, sensor kinase
VVQLSTEKVIFLTLAICGGFFSLVFFFLLALLRNFKLQTAQQKRIVETIVNTQDQERFRISQELHDNVGSALTGIDYELNHLKNTINSGENNPSNIEHLVNFQNKARQGLRTAINDLSPFDTEQGNWLEALENLINYMQGKGITVNLNVSGEPVVFSGNSQLNLFRLMQELVQNVLKHSQANEVFISLNYQPQRFEIIFEDDGKGFDTKLMTSGFGFYSIKARTMVLKGEKKVISNSEDGTKWMFNFKNENLLKAKE